MFAISCVRLSTVNLGHILSHIDTFLGNAYNPTGLHENQAIVGRDNNEVESTLSIRDTYKPIAPIVMYCNFL
jgi:hypothetical protein